MRRKIEAALLTTFLSVVFIPKVRAQPPNAWQITDASASHSLNYTNILPTPLQIAATNAGFDFSVNARFLTNFGRTKAMTMIYGLGSRRFLIWWNQDANGDLTAELEGGSTYTLTTNGTGTALYHTHEIVYDPVTRKASYLFDGVALTTNWSGSATSWPAGEITWGSGSSSGEGQMNFHRVSFVVTNGIVAGYDAGTEPASAPDPESRSWSLSPPSPPTGVNTHAISPDSAPLPASTAITTLAATRAQPYQAWLSGRVNPGGLGTTAWFEWGTDANYGNTTAPQFLPADTNALDFSQPITGLAKGATYHFRCVSTNTLGRAYGQDAEFTTPLEFSVSTLADGGNGSLRQCISAAQSGDTVTFATNGTLTLVNGELLVTNNLTITGPGPANLAIDANGNSRVMEITNANVTLNSLTLTNGYSSRDPGAGVYVNTGASLTVSNCAVKGNSGYNGGGIGNSGALTVNNSALSGNTSYNAGGIENLGTLSINNSTLSGNSAASLGGGIANSGTLSINNSTLSANSATNGAGGGIYNLGASTINNSTLSSNSAPGGGGIENSGSAIFNNATLYGNSAETYGGGIYNNGTNTLNNCTLAGNAATYGSGGGLYQADSGISALTNTIVAGNTASNNPDIYGSFGSVSTVNSFTSGNPLLAPLGNYGGPTRTMPPLAGSPAIDYGDDSATRFLATDQRGYPRKSGAHVDIGAVEAQIAPANNPPHLLAAPSGVGGGNSFQFTFTNVPNADFTVLASTNLALPLRDWISIGNAAQNLPGQYQFTDPDTASYPRRFFQVVSP